MSCIEDQLKLENEMVNRGVARYKASLKAAEEKGRIHELGYGARIVKSYITAISEGIDAFVNDTGARSGGQYRRIIGSVDSHKLALLTLRQLCGTFVHEKTLASLAVKLGQMVEDELKFSKFQLLYGEYYDEIVRDFKRKGTESYSHKHRVLTHTANKRGLEWTKWPSNTHLRVGAKLLDIILAETDLAERKTYYNRGKSEVKLQATPQAVEWIQEHTDHMAMLCPDLMPCVIPPDDWTAMDQGGFYSPRLRSHCKLVKDRRMSKAHRALLDGADLSRVMSAVNAIQRTGWKVNTRVLDVFRTVWHQNLAVGMPPAEPYAIPPCPLGEDVKPRELTEGSPEYVAFMNWKLEAAETHTMEKERISKCFQIMRTLRIANEMVEHPAFWYVYQLDFRGRLYTATAGLTPQGTDVSKGLLCFSEGMPVGERGMYWLKVHGANKYGFDKVPYDDRVKWVEEHHKEILSVAGDPVSHRSHWADADKPWQYLAFCFEYADMQMTGERHVSYLPISLDGSCNGLQNFSAMLRDEVGGAATNLVPCDKPADVYTDVAKLATSKIIELLDGPEPKLWSDWMMFFGRVNTERTMPRGIAKAPVMTLPYGSTMNACTSTTFRFIREKGTQEFESAFLAARTLTPVIWQSINETVIAARVAMDWIQNCSSIISKKNEPLIWHTPLGFPVFQENKAFDTKQVETQIGGRVQLRIATERDKIDVRRQRQGSSPNFIHSVDATHLMMTVNRASEEDVQSFAVIHDDFGTHAANTEILHRAIREAFVDLHDNHNLLQAFKVEQEDRVDVVLPEAPAMGNLQVSGVLNSAYFFG